MFLMEQEVYPLHWCARVYYFSVC